MAHFADPTKIWRCDERDIYCIRDGPFDLSLSTQQEDIANRDASKHQVVPDHFDREAERIRRACGSRLGLGAACARRVPDRKRHRHQIQQLR
ncbi:hypothetical protein BCEP4_680062 [Burkholderia cepacia]|nr:hypothetical protein BCEP4_680062 [Burkholderia cepacia]